jgi:hypothetical protein
MLRIMYSLCGNCSQANLSPAVRLRPNLLMGSKETVCVQDNSELPRNEAKFANWTCSSRALALYSILCKTLLISAMVSLGVEMPVRTLSTLSSRSMLTLGQSDVRPCSTSALINASSDIETNSMAQEYATEISCGERETLTWLPAGIEERWKGAYGLVEPVLLSKRPKPGTRKARDEVGVC